MLCAPALKVLPATAEVAVAQLQPHAADAARVLDLADQYQCSELVHGSLHVKGNERRGTRILAWHAEASTFTAAWRDVALMVGISTKQVGRYRAEAEGLGLLPLVFEGKGE